jgi:2-isopropylmalate synthase
MDNVFIFDTTLRDGEQSAGVTLNTREKLEIARQLEKLGVDIIEAGFPATSPGDFEAVSRIAREVRTPVICGLARAVSNDVDRACEAVKEAASPRVHVFISSSDIHLVYQYKKNRDEILEMGRAMVARAKKQYSDVEFSPMDASRTDPEFLYKILEAAIEAGATTVNIPDTVGYAMPAEWGNVIEGILNHVPNIHRAVISVHCHNDLGMAVANSLEAVRRGARQIECTINGIGERAGNASLEEAVMGLKTRQEYFSPGLPCNRTKPSWAVMPSGMNRAFTRTVLSKCPSPTKLSIPKASDYRPIPWFWASFPAATPSASVSKNWVII